jgi:hypothetical protein
MQALTDEIYMEDFPGDENGQALRNMALNGDDIHRPRDINFSVVFQEKLPAERFIQSATSSGIKAKYTLDYDSDKWDVTVTLMLIPTHNSISQIEECLQNLATPLGGRNDGWGCYELR